MPPGARLVWLDRPAPPVPLEGGVLLTIGRDPANRLCLAEEAGLSRRHAELRPRGADQWLLCDLGSSNGTFVEGERLSGCRPLAPGDRIRLGRRGPLLQFELGGASGSGVPGQAPIPPAGTSLPLSPHPSASRAIPSRAHAPAAPEPTGSSTAAPAPAAASRSSPRPAAAAAARGRGASNTGPATSPPPPNPSLLEGSLTVAGRSIPLGQIRGVEVRSQARHPHLFSWWVPACLGGLLLLPFPLLFWPWQAAALIGAILLGRRQEHTLILTLRDGRAHRHVFADRPTALAHGRGVRRALGLDPDAQP